MAGPDAAVGAAVMYQAASSARYPTTPCPQALFLLAAPTLIIFLLFQRVFIGSVTSGAIK